MKIAIIGYGKMGRMIESIALEKGHTIGARIDISNQDLLSRDSLRQHDVAVEFTGPETAYQNIKKCLDAGLPVVSGSTGWTDRLEELAELCRKVDGSFLYASNFNLGVNILFHLNRQLASIMNRQELYRVRMTEIHHTQKKDAPSGTALSLAGDIIASIDRIRDWTLIGPAESSRGIEGGNSADRDAGRATGGSTDGKISEAKPADILMIEAVREGEIPGIHEITYESAFDSLSVRHSAKDRRGFATGAILAAEYVCEKKGLFTMKDVLDL